MSAFDRAGALVLAQPAGNTNNGPSTDKDIVDFLTDGQNYLEKLGAAILGVVGLALLIWAGISAAKKFFSEQDRTSWAKIGMMVLVGGILMVGGIAWIMSLSESAQNTVDEFGDTSTGALSSVVLQLDQAPTGAV